MERREVPRQMELDRKVDSYRRALFEAGAVRIAPSADTLFTLRNGSTSWVFVDNGLLLPNPETNTVFVNALSYAITSRFQKDTTVLANVGSKSSPHTVGAIAYAKEYRQIAVNLEAIAVQERGTELRLRVPEIKTGDTILVIDDVMTPKDTTIIDTVEQIRKDLGEKANTVQFHALVGLMRDKRAVEELAQQGITAHYLLTLDDLLKSSFESLHLTSEQREGLEKELALSS